MKRIALVIALLAGAALSVYAAPTYSGAEGYIALPRVDVADAGRFGISFKYSTPGVLTPSINIVPFKMFEIGAGWDINTAGGAMNPILLNVKLQFVKPAALGLSMEIPMESTGNFTATLYLAWEERFQAGTLADSFATFLLGYTFNEGSNINFGIGIQKNLFIPQLFLIADFGNFPYRHGQAGGALLHQDENRAIFNGGLRVILTKWLSFDFCGLDVLDAGQRELMIGANLYVSLWGGSHR